MSSTPRRTLAVALAVVAALAFGGLTAPAAVAIVKTGTATVQGTALRANGDPADSGLATLQNSSGTQIKYAELNNDGSFAFGALPAGTYTVKFDSRPSLSPYWYGSKSLASAKFFTLRAGATVTVPTVVIPDGSSITGTLDCSCESGESRPRGSVVLLNSDGDGIETSHVSTSYEYSFEGVPAGRYSLQFEVNSAVWADQFYGGTYSRNEAEFFDVPAEEEVTLAPVQLNRHGKLSGSILGEVDGQVSALSAGSATLVSVDGGQPVSASTTDGTFEITRIPPGRYVLRAGSSDPLLSGSGWYVSPGSTADRTIIDVAPNSNNEGFDTVVAPGATVAGKITWLANPAAGWEVRLFPVYDGAAARDDSLTVNTDSTGSFSLENLPAGDYKIKFKRKTADFFRYSFYYGGTATFEKAAIISIASGSTATLNADLGKYKRTIQRIVATDRYGQAVAVSKVAFPEGAPVVWIANGSSPYNAVSPAAAAQHQGGPLLLVPGTTISSAVVAEIKRLKPGKIVVVGSSTIVGSAVATKLAALAPVSRISGTEKYALSAAVNRFAFGKTGVSTMVVARGDSWASAQSGASAAAILDAPVLLLDPKYSTATSTVQKLVQDLRVERIHSANAMTNAMYASFYYIPSVWDVFVHKGDAAYGAADLGEAAVMYREASAETVILTSSSSYTYAMAGASLSAKLDAPLLFAKGSCLPAATYDYMQQLDTPNIIILGSATATVSGKVSLKRC